MRRAEKVILSIIVGVIVVVGGIKAWLGQFKINDVADVPFYTTASTDLNRHANALYKQHNCKQCHLLWGSREMSQSVPAPALDGIGSLHDEAWFFTYFSSENPQAIIPSRLKKQYRMPSFATLPELDRRALAQYMASLKVNDEYIDDVRKAEYEKLTGLTYSAPSATQP